MKIVIVHPSRGRPEQAIETATKWLDRADTKIEYILSLDKDDIHNYTPHYQGLAQRKDCIFWVPEPLPHKSAIEAINYGAAVASPFDLIIVVSDDFDCPEHWDTLLLEALKDKSDFIVKTQDGIQKTLITLPIMDRTYYDRFGYVYFGEYQHLWCDTEMTVVGMYLGKVITLPIEFKHNHYSIGASPKDAISIKNDSSWRQGEILFKRRLKQNFGVERPLIKYSDIKWR